MLVLDLLLGLAVAAVLAYLMVSIYCESGATELAEAEQQLRLLDDAATDLATHW
jgi:hypothetical protein